MFNQCKQYAIKHTSPIIWLEVKIRILAVSFTLYRCFVDLRGAELLKFDP